MKASTEGASSYRRILQSSSIIGGASVMNILIGLVREKALAILLGPVGVGLASLYRGLLTTVSTVATMGLDTAGTRQIAEAKSRSGDQALATARRALSWGSWGLAGAGTGLVCVFRRPLSELVLGNTHDAGIVGLLALGVGFTVFGAAQVCQVQGMQRIADLARISVYSASVSTALGVAVVWKWGQPAIVYYVLAIPAANLIFGYIYAKRLPKQLACPIAREAIIDQWRTLFHVGVAFMGGAVAMSAVQLWIRMDVDRVLGPRALGQCQAAWLISTTYVAFVLNAMGADYYPRLTGVIHDHDAATRLVNEQTEIALLLSTPLLVAMMGVAPWVIRTLYTAEFAPSIAILRWQVLSNVLKVASWPLGFVFVADGDGKTFFWTEVVSLVVMGGTITLFLRPVGLGITGSAYLVSYVFYLPLMYWLGKRRIAFSWTRSVTKHLALTFTVCAAVGVLASYTSLGAPVGCAAAMAFALHGFGKVSHISNLSGTAGRLGAIARKMTTFSRKGI